MNRTLTKIKRCIIDGCVGFTAKAAEEMQRDGLMQPHVYESILNAQQIRKVLRSRSPGKKPKREYLYVIESTDFDGTPIYTKWKLEQRDQGSLVYVLISAKIDEGGES